MHNENLEVLRNEAMRLIELEDAALRRICQVPGLLAEQEAENYASFDVRTIEGELQVLLGEKGKLETMEMVIAVVGTMKAGKSTTINTIVGEEVLPNRNEPMTAMPTLIRHTPGQKVPVALFANNAPINELLSQLKDVIHQSPERIHGVSSASKEMAELVDFVSRVASIDQRYEGREEIFNLLKTLNDLVRLCSELDVPFPFSDYDEMHELPVIQVEFATLPEHEAGLGRITLLDTPGPNEAGQAHLKVMLRDQLRKASAVLAVLNYTNLKSESDDEFRAEVQQIADVSKGRMYALVNKYDQRSHRDPDEAEVRATVSKVLLRGDVPEECVFAVSAKRGFLAEMVRKHLHERGSLPDYREHEWVAEFAESCFGLDWQEDIEDKEEIERGAEKLWRRSGFAHPIERVIRTAHQNAAIFALESSAAKIHHLSERITNFLEGRKTSLKKTAEELQRYIADLKGDVENVSVLRTENEEKIRELISDLQADVDECFDEAKAVMIQASNKIFNRKLIEDNNKKDRLASKKTSTKERLAVADTVTVDVVKNTPNFLGLVGRRRRKSENDVFEGRNKVEFRTWEETEEFLEKLQSDFLESIEGMSGGIASLMQDTASALDSTINDVIVKKSAALLADVGSRLGKEGFELNFSLPSNMNASISSVRADTFMSSYSKTGKSVTRLREQSGLGGSIKRGVGRIFGKSDWGYEEYKANISVFVVEKARLEKKVEGLIDKQASRWRAEMNASFANPVLEATEQFFGELSAKLEAVRADLFQGITDKSKSEAEQLELIEAISGIGVFTSGMREDSLALSDESRKLTETEQ